MNFPRGAPITAIDENTLPDLDGKNLFNVPVNTPAVVFANLPVTPKQGDRALLSDAASSPTWLAVVSAGGHSTIAPVFFDGTNWRFG